MRNRRAVFWHRAASKDGGVWRDGFAHCDTGHMGGLSLFIS